jgi:hypothetical protein
MEVFCTFIIVRKRAKLDVPVVTLHACSMHKIENFQSLKKGSALVIKGGRRALQIEQKKRRIF